MSNPHVLVCVLNQYERLPSLLTELHRLGIQGATVISSSGMAQVLSRESDFFFSSLRAFVSAEHEDNRTLFMVLDESQLDTARQAIRAHIEPRASCGAGIVFALPLAFAEYLGRCTPQS